MLSIFMCNIFKVNKVWKNGLIHTKPEMSELIEVYIDFKDIIIGLLLVIYFSR